MMENKQTTHSPENERFNDTNEEAAVEAEETPTPDLDDETSEAAAGDDEHMDKQGEPSDEAAALQAEVSKLEAQLNDMKNRYLRAQADLDNFRRRTRKEKEEQAKYASLSVIKALLPALDNLERALNAGRETDSSDGLIQGVEMVNRQILDTLEQEGLKPIPAVGEPFNPEYHEAVMQVQSDEHEAGIVVEELQKGYQLKDRVIRPSMVKVSE